MSKAGHIGTLIISFRKGLSFDGYITVHIRIR